MKKGISLVALIITIVVLIILTATVIINVGGENSVINKARKAVFLNDVATFEEDFLIKKLNEQTKGQDVSDIWAEYNDGANSEITDMKYWIKSYTKYGTDFTIEQSKLIYQGEDQQKVGWLTGTGVDISGRIPNKSENQEQIAQLEVVIESIENGIQNVQSIEGVVCEINSILTRISDLTAQAQNEQEIELIEVEIEGLLSEIDNQYNSILSKILNISVGTNSSELVNYNLPNISTSGLGEGDGILVIDISTPEAAEASSQRVQDAISKTISARAEMGAIQRRIEYALEYNSRVRDVLNEGIRDNEIESNTIKAVGLNVVINELQRVRDLTVGAINSIAYEESIDSLSLEINEHIPQINMIIQNCNNKGTNLLSSEFTGENALNLNQVNISTISNAEQSLIIIDSALEKTGTKINALL